MRLIAPESYRVAHPGTRKKLCNGCGGAGSWLAWLVPNHILGICVREACNIHDWMYAHHMGKAWSDLVLLCNLLILCGRGSRWLLPIRAAVCPVYYLAVVFGGRRFYRAKVSKRLRCDA